MSGKKGGQGEKERKKRKESETCSFETCLGRIGSSLLPLSQSLSTFFLFFFCKGLCFPIFLCPLCTVCRVWEKRWRAGQIEKVLLVCRMRGQFLFFFSLHVLRCPISFLFAPRSVHRPRRVKAGAFPVDLGCWGSCCHAVDGSSGGWLCRRGRGTCGRGREVIIYVLLSLFFFFFFFFFCPSFFFGFSFLVGLSPNFFFPVSSILPALMERKEEAIREVILHGLLPESRSHIWKRLSGSIDLEMVGFTNHINTHIHTHIHTHKYIYMHTYVHTQTPAQPHIHINTPTHAYPCPHPHPRPHMYTHPHIHTYTHTCIHNTDTQTQMHTDAQQQTTIATQQTPSHHPSFTEIPKLVHGALSSSPCTQNRRGHSCRHPQDVQFF